MSTASLIRSETAARVLALLASLGGEELHTNELIRRTGSNPNAIQRTLTHLEEAGLLRSRRLGNLRLWRMDSTHPLYPSVRDLVVRTRGIPIRLAKILGRDAAIAFAFLFGSFVSAKDDAQSDVDIFVVGAADWGVLARAVRAASTEIGRELRPVVWSLRDLKSPSAAQRAFLDNVLVDPVIWLIGERDEFERNRQLATAVAQRGAASPSQPGARKTARERGTSERRTRSKGAEGR